MTKREVIEDLIKNTSGPVTIKYLARLSRSQKATVKMPYDAWERLGYLTLTNTPIVDQNFVMKYVLDECDKYNLDIQCLCFDPANASKIMMDLSDQGHTVEEVYQSHKSLNEATQGFREQVYAGNVAYTHNPLLKGQLYYHYTDPKTGQDYVYRQDSVLHFKTWLTWDGIMGKSVQDILKTTVGSAGYSQSYLNELYKSGMTASSTLQYTGELDDKLRAKLQKKYNDLLTGVKNAGKVVAIPVGFTLQPLTYKLTDAQYYEMRKYTALQIAAAFGVKPNQINDYEKSSYANSETQQLAFLVDTMLFRLTMYEQEINYKCLTHKERSKGFLFKFNEKVLLRANAESQMQVITSAIQNGVYTPNEGRHYLDLPSKEGGDVLIVNGNYVSLTSVGAAYGVSGEGGKD